ncbi:MAG: hypothetical protein AVDCRST_MAG59-2673 [uncultured Thermomicrobiales bacterium]|uniref:Uncharacterized protein n=1 Tax=uncultured Thermomicrobiales bacterium TaxID=1645740 RepID=A0A6J4UW01_9BACT|nr:MAG: hypothetical protein AVDCRST_MAG59-2673 [uncultured Thermomicrobiales bacterium]
MDNANPNTAVATQEPEQAYFALTSRIPEEAWYWAAVGSIGASAVLKLAGKDHWALFVGQWPPTFLLFGLYHRIARPGQ